MVAKRGGGGGFGGFPPGGGGCWLLPRWGLLTVNNHDRALNFTGANLNFIVKLWTILTGTVLTGVILTGYQRKSMI